MGMDLLRVLTEAIDMSLVYEALSDPECGAQLVFTGTVRNENEGRGVRAVHYEAFAPLAETVFGDLAREVREKVGTPLRLVMMHRVGTLKVGVISTVIGVASAHRAESYAASRYLIEQLKIRVPVWKEEHYIDGEKTWLDGTELSAPYCGGHPGRGAIEANGAE